jgi:hypothetical protein
LVRLFPCPSFAQNSFVRPDGREHLQKPRHRWQSDVKVNVNAVVMFGLWTVFVWLGVEGLVEKLLTRL